MTQIFLAPLMAAAAALLLLQGGCAPIQEGSTSLPPADERAIARQEGVIELGWQPPQDRLDGAPLRRSEIAGYRIYVGETPGRHSRTIEIDDPEQTSYLLRGLQPGKEYYVAISTVDREGQESPKSDEIEMAAAPITDSQFASPDAYRPADRQRASVD